ncbi:MAG: hypothetical protein GY861_22075 [bacterium]|nr:hypothetical protein [bacterium]
MRIAKNKELSTVGAAFKKIGGELKLKVVEGPIDQLIYRHLLDVSKIIAVILRENFYILHITDDCRYIFIGLNGRGRILCDGCSDRDFHDYLRGVIRIPGVEMHAFNSNSEFKDWLCKALKEKK